MGRRALGRPGLVPVREWAQDWPSLIDGYVSALATYDGSMFAGGRFNEAGDHPSHYIARWIDDGVQTPPVVQVTVGDGYGEHGEVVDVPIIARRKVYTKDEAPLKDAVSLLAGLDLVLTWDPAIAQLLEVLPGADGPTWLLQSNVVTPGDVHIAAAGLPGVAIEAAGAEMLRLRFRVGDPDDVSPLTLAEVWTYDDSGQPLPHEGIDGSLASGCVKADVRHDGQINSADAVVVLRVAAALVEPTPVERCAADVNSSGVVNAGDAVLVLRRAVGLDKHSEHAPPGLPTDPGNTVTASPARVAVVLGQRADQLILQCEGGAGFDVVLRFDPDALELSLAQGSSAPPLVVSNGSTPGALRISVAGPDIIPGGVRLGLRLVASHSTEVRIDACAAFDARGEAMPCEPGVAVRLEAGVPVPGRPRLICAAPNPFNPATVLSFELGSPQDAQLSIVDSAGRLVRRITLHALQTGRHDVRWDGLDEAGTPAASGVYLVELRSDAGADSRKIVLVR